MPVFEIYDDKTARCIEVNTPRITVGRTADNAVMIDDRQSSRCHCEIRHTDVGYILRDLSSRNGTRLNQDTIDRSVTLRDGDEIGIGHATIRFWSNRDRLDLEAVRLPLIPVDDPCRTSRRQRHDNTSGDTPGRSARKRLPHPPKNQPPSKRTPDDTDIEIKLVAADIAATTADERFQGPLDINHIIPLNHEGKPAHPVGDNASGVSEAMLQLKQLLLKSFQLAATDIHIEPREQKLHLRYRIDGHLHHVSELETRLARSVYSIVKLLCNLDINKKNIMQDGSFATQLPDRRVDLRVSIVPSTRGDKMVLRILDKKLAPDGLDSLGMEPYILQQIRRKVFQESSMMVVCGPTGSGKTTTVYAVLQEMNTLNKNIVTVEDPVEYKLTDITQIQVNPRFDVTFASALGSLLRQDPDVILIGEIRDNDTAHMAIQSAMTGHLVLTTLHARDSIGSIFRLLDLGVEPFLLGSALTMVLSQRLLRRLCSRCKMRIKPPMKKLTRMSLEDLAGADLYSAVGCDQCAGIGYKGRVPIFELLTINDQVRDAIANRPTIQQLRIAAGDWIFQTLKQDAVRKLRVGTTTLEEFSLIGADE